MKNCYCTTRLQRLELDLKDTTPKQAFFLLFLFCFVFKLNGYDHSFHNHHSLLTKLKGSPSRAPLSVFDQKTVRAEC